MFNYNSYLIQGEQQDWRNAYEIKMAALRHEERRMQMRHTLGSSIQRKAKLSHFLTLPLRMLAALIG